MSSGGTRSGHFASVALLFSNLSTDERRAFLAQRLRLMDTSEVVAVIRTLSAGQVHDIAVMLSHRMASDGP